MLKQNKNFSQKRAGLSETERFSRENLLCLANFSLANQTIDNNKAQSKIFI